MLIIIVENYALYLVQKHLKKSLLSFYRSL